MRKLLIALALCFYACAAHAQLGWNFGDSPHRSNETFNRLNLGPANGNKILATGATGIMLPTLTLPSVVQQNITQTGILTTDILAKSGRPWADVRAFGAKGDSVTDDTAAFNAAIAAVTALGSGTIYVPPSTGSYCIKTAGGITLSAFGLRMVGATDGYYSSLDACGTDTTIVTMNNQYVSLEHILIAGKGINDTTTFGASYPTIKVTNACISCSIEHVNVTGGAFAIQGLGTPSQHVDDVMLFDVVAYQSYQTLIDIQDGGWWINRAKLDQNWPYSEPTPGIGTIPNWAASTAHSAGDLVITQGWIIQYMTSGTTGTTAPTLKNYARTITDGTATAQIAQPSSQYYAIHFEGASETQMTQVDMSGSFYSGLYVDQDSSGNPSQYIECSQCIAGQTLNSAIYLNYGHSVYITDSHFGSCLYSGCGIVLVNDTYTGDFNMEGGAFLGTGIGALVGGSGGTTFQGVTFNGQSTGIQMNAGSNLTAVGNRLGVNGTGSDGTVTTGISILSGANHYTVLGNMCVNVTTCISDNGGGSDKMVQRGAGVALSGVAKVISIADFLPPGQPDGTTNNTAAFTSAASQACANGGGEIFLPASTNAYVIKDALITCSGVTVRGVKSMTLGYGTIWNYTGASLHGLLYQPTCETLAPASGTGCTQSQNLTGNKVQDITFYDSNSSDTSTTALEMDGFNSCEINNIGVMGSPMSGVALKHGYRCYVSDYTDNYYTIYPSGGLRGYALYVEGDLSGKGQSGASCTVNYGDCATRVDLVKFDHIDHLGNSGYGITLSGMVFSTAITHAYVENDIYGFQTQCSPGFPDIGHCPANIDAVDLESEGATSYGIYLSDFTDFRCDQCFSDSNGAASGHALYAININYTGSGGVHINGGRWGNQAASCLYISVNDFSIQGANIYNCAKNNNTGFYGVELQSGTQGIVNGNFFCTFNGVASTAFPAVVVDSGFSQATVFGNTFKGCYSGLTNNSSSSSSVISAVNLGP